MESSQRLTKGIILKCKENLIFLLLMGSIPLVNIFYPILNSSNRGVNSLVTDLDRGLPLLKVFILPYISWYGFIFITLAYLCLKDRRGYFKTLISINLSLLVCYTIYFFYQTTVPRPIINETDWLTELVALIYQADEPFNCFPSIHCLTSYLMMKAINNSSAKNLYNQSIIYPLAILIILSTLFVKQHVFLDVIIAILLGDIIYDFVTIMEGEGGRLWKGKLYLWWTMKKKLEI
jgi:membrane-associated phospholipid phosphatase